MAAARTSASPSTAITPAPAHPCPLSPEDVAALPGLSSLSDEQRAAVTSDPEGAQVVLACAGSGKTRVIVARIAWLVRCRNIRPQSITCVTFTRTAAANMRLRIREWIGDTDAAKLYITTYHGLSMLLCRMFIEDLGGAYKKNFGLLSDEDALETMREVAARHGPAAPASTKTFDKFAGKQTDPVDEAAHVVHAAVRGYYLTLGEKPLTLKDPVYQRILEEWQALCELNQVMGFSQLLHYARAVLMRVPAAQGFLSRRARYIIVDEFQDTSTNQATLLHQMCCGTLATSALGQMTPRLTVVGDDSQAIYSFQGASPDEFNRLLAHWPACVVRQLSVNYRSAGHIVNASAAMVQGIIPSIIPREYRSARGMGEKVRVVEADSAISELHYISSVIREGVSKHGWAYNDIAIMARSNRSVRIWAQQLQSCRIPYERAGSSIMRLNEVHHVIALLRIIVSDDANDAAKRTLFRLAADLSEETKMALLQGRRAPTSPGGESTFMERVRDVTQKLKGDLAEHAAELDASGFVPTPAVAGQKRRRALSKGRGGKLAAGAAGAAPGVQMRRLEQQRDYEKLKKFVDTVDTLRADATVLKLAEFLKRLMKHTTFVRRQVSAQDPTLEDELKRESSWRPTGLYSLALTTTTSTAAQPDTKTSLWEALLDEAERFASTWEAPEDDESSPTSSPTDAKVKSMNRNMTRLRDFVDMLCDSTLDGAKTTDSGKGSVALTRRPAVWLGTVHQAKGLEWRCVFLPRLNEGTFPNVRTGGGETFNMASSVSNDGSPDLDEEHRVAYVALSRAVEQLHLTYLSCDSYWGWTSPSRFIELLPEGCQVRLNQDKAFGPPVTMAEADPKSITPPKTLPTAAPAVPCIAASTAAWKAPPTAPAVPFAAPFGVRPGMPGKRDTP